MFATSYTAYVSNGVEQRAVATRYLYERLQVETLNDVFEVSNDAGGLRTNDAFVSNASLEKTGSDAQSSTSTRNHLHGFMGAAEATKE